MGLQSKFTVYAAIAGVLALMGGIVYYASLDNVHSAYSFLSTASSGFQHETWHGSDIATIVGQRDGH